MSDPNRPFAASGPVQADAVASFLGAMREAWKQGAVACQAFASGMQPGDAAEAAQLGDMAPALAEAWIVATASAFRYWFSLADVHAKHQASLLRTLTDQAAQTAAPAEKGRILVDDLRAYLREFGDVASFEARRLQAELERVGESVAQAGSRADPQEDQGDDKPRRRHRVKR
jgi:hypothetical protein